jgi:hypothetical protein
MAQLQNQGVKGFEPIKRSLTTMMLHGFRDARGFAVARRFLLAKSHHGSKLPSIDVTHFKFRHNNDNINVFTLDKAHACDGIRPTYRFKARPLGIILRRLDRGRLIVAAERAVSRIPHRIHLLLDMRSCCLGVFGFLLPFANLVF